jgi:superfamily II DNA or RNA helicase
LIEVRNGADVPLPLHNPDLTAKILGLFTYPLYSGAEFANFKFQNGVASFPPNMEKIHRVGQLLQQEVKDCRSPGRALSQGSFELQPGFQLRDYQLDPSRRLYSHIKSHQSGTLSAGCGTGKTVVMTFVAGWFQKRILVLIDQSNLIGNWVDAFKAIWGRDLEKITAKTTEPGDCCICTFQLLARNPELLQRLRSRFGMLLVDEAHTVTADTFRDVLMGLDTYYKIGCSATFHNKKLPQAVLNDLIAPICVKMVDHGALRPQVLMLETGVSWPADDPNVFGNQILPALAANEGRNMQIFGVIRLLAEAGRRILLVGIKAVQMRLLHQMLQQVGISSVVYTGTTSPKKDDQIKADFNAGKIQVVMTCKKLDKGTDLDSADVLISAKPNNNLTATQQQSGRVVRKLAGKPTPLVIDLVDSGALAQRFANNRRKWYRSLGYPVTDLEKYTDLNNYVDMNNSLLYNKAH